MKLYNLYIFVKLSTYPQIKVGTKNIQEINVVCVSLMSLVVLYNEKIIKIKLTYKIKKIKFLCHSEVTYIKLFVITSCHTFRKKG